ncbi:MAG: WxL domain-containing protein [Turicibacter sp.]|nr:WxL domain-containing protein [Turicibacter sp.]
MKKIKKMVFSATIAALVIGNLVPTIVLADGGEYESEAAVEFVPFTGVTPPRDPDNPGDTVSPYPDPNPGTSGPLSIDFASTFDFGVNQITNEDMTYYALPQLVRIADSSGEYRLEPRPHYVQVTDSRGSNAGWSLQVRQNGQLSYEDTLHDTLHGAQISVTGVTPASISTAAAPSTHDFILDPEGAASNVMLAAQGEGALTWIARFGALSEVDDELRNTNVSLFVPGATPKDAVVYTTTLTWILTDVPGN